MKALLVILFLTLPTLSNATCRLALALALDVSGSVDEADYRMQMSGLAEALADPHVQAVLFAVPASPVAIAVFEWSGSGYQRLIQDWVLLKEPATLNALTAKLANWRRAPAPHATGLGAAMRFGNALINGGPACWQATLDVSGDGKNNDWPAPETLKTNGELGSLRINGLVIARTGPNEGEAAAELSAYFKARVIRGPDAFVEVALGFRDYASAMRRKLLRELQTRPMGQLRLPDRTVLPVLLSRQ